MSGPEHCGKTAFLLRLKQLRPERSFFVPGQSTLSFDFENRPVKDESVGETIEWGVESRLIQCLRELKEVSQGGILLLDDWDVYLGPRAAEKVNQAIDELALVRCVFETKRTGF